MPDVSRIPEVLKAFGDFWMRYPDLRLGQLIESARAFSDWKGDTFNIEDDTLLAGLAELDRISRTE